jgi:DNA-binding transcriptional ArsR family regulator
MSNPDTAGAEGNPSTLMGWSSDARIAELCRENPEAYIGLTEAIHNSTQRKILYTLVNGLGDASYTELDQTTTVSRRSLRKHISRLEDAGLVERTDSNYSLVSFTSFEVRVLAQHLIYCYDEQL